ncbi:MAG: TraR/DksA family transcriptional regulator [Chloroflexi bacterium]|nr:TraR/DksA family transcriptional regulator [Chloroflexota bacterium]
MAINTKELREVLESERARLTQDLNQLKTGLLISDDRREGSPFGKREEEATEALELEKRLAMERRLQGQLAEVVNALAKLEKGTYGYCDVCGLPIDPARLQALPQANLCLKCKAQQAKVPRGKPSS